MAIEINELVVKSKIDSEGGGFQEPAGEDRRQELERMRERILSDCRELFHELFEEVKER